MALAKTYRDDEYYTTKETAEKFFELVVKPSGILKHKTLLMPFTTLESPLYIVATQYHDHIIVFTGDMDLWKKAGDYEDVAVVDNPPFSLSTPIEKYYFSKDTVVILSSMLQFVYKNGEVKTSKVSSSKQDGTNNSMYGYMLMFYIANLISSLKKDFTGYVINPKQILLIKIKDLDSHKNKLLFDQAEKNVQKELKKIGVTI